MNEGGRVEFFKEELQAQSMFPRRFTEPEEISHAIIFLLENSMMNAFHVGHPPPYARGSLTRKLKCDAGWRMITNWGTDEDRE
jgi:3-hydroxyacyl-CoA dehydrogenase